MSNETKTVWNDDGKLAEAICPGDHELGGIVLNLFYIAMSFIIIGSAYQMANNRSNSQTSVAPISQAYHV